MGRIAGRHIKKAAHSIIEKYFTRVNVDFENNLAVVKDVTITQCIKTRNQVAGYLTHLYKRVIRGSTKGIYIKSHEQEKEKKESFIPKVGVLDAEKVVVDSVTYEMVKKYNIQGNFVVHGSETASR